MSSGNEKVSIFLPPGLVDYAEHVIQGLQEGQVK